MLSTNTSTAQTFRAGITIGTTSTDIDHMDSRDYDNDFNKLGYVVGGILNFDIDKKNLFQMELNYIKKGTLQKPDSMNMNSYKLALDYLEVPLLVRHRIHFQIRQIAIDKFDLEMGASIGRMIRYNWMVDGQNSPMDPNSFNKTDVSLLLGVNYNFSSNGSLSFRYTNSVIPAIKHDAYPGYIFFNTFNTGNNLVFQMSLKLMFGGNKEKE